jgi:hypothetical protein
MISFTVEEWWEQMEVLPFPFPSHPPASSAGFNSGSELQPVSKRSMVGLKSSFSFYGSCHLLLTLGGRGGDTSLNINRCTFTALAVNLDTQTKKAEGERAISKSGTWILGDKETLIGMVLSDGSMVAGMSFSGIISITLTIALCLLCLGDPSHFHVTAARSGEWVPLSAIPCVGFLCREILIVSLCST